jgi:CHAT domain-containing protein
LLPLQILWNNKDGKRNYLIESYIISYAPSLKILKQCRERKRNKKSNVVIAHANPKGTNYLPFSRNEAKKIRSLFKQSELINEAKAKDIIEFGRKANILHYTGHATSQALILQKQQVKISDSQNLENIEEFNLGDIIEKLELPESYLVCLSACETGIINIGNEADEYIGLTGGFLYSGAATVVCSLWAVQDYSTSILMGKMYEYIKDGYGKAEALNKAQNWIRNLKNLDEYTDMTSEIYWPEKDEPFKKYDLSHPYYWAGFICSGAD